MVTLIGFSLLTCTFLYLLVGSVGGSTIQALYASLLLGSLIWTLHLYIMGGAYSMFRAIFYETKNELGREKAKEILQSMAKDIGEALPAERFLQETGRKK